LDKILLVGGMTADGPRDDFALSSAPIVDDVNPDEAVAIGAAIQNPSLCGGNISGESFVGSTSTILLARRRFDPGDQHYVSHPRSRSLG
jgi:molecular chaperone DnaK (HSP70)